MPTGEPPQKIKGSAPMYLPQKVVWKKYKFVPTMKQTYSSFFLQEDSMAK